MINRKDQADKTDQAEKFFYLDETAYLLGITEQRLQQLSSQGNPEHLPCLKPGFSSAKRPIWSQSQIQQAIYQLSSKPDFYDVSEAAAYLDISGLKFVHLADQSKPGSLPILAPTLPNHKFTENRWSKSQLDKVVPLVSPLQPSISQTPISSIDLNKPDPNSLNPTTPSFITLTKVNGGKISVSLETIIIVEEGRMDNTVVLNTTAGTNNIRVKESYQEILDLIALYKKD